MIPASGGLGGSAPRHVQGGFNPQPQHITTFRTKKDVDQHVEFICRQELSDKERSLRYYSIARSYASVREFNLAKRFLQSYIDAHPTAPGLAEAYKVMGDILVDMRESEAALESYKKSHSITPSRVTLNRICDLLSNGFGEKETAESRKEWYTRQKTAASMGVTDPRPPHQRPETFQNPPPGSSPGYKFHSSSPNVPLSHNGGPDSGHQQRTPQRSVARQANAGEITPRNLLSQLQPQLNGVQEPEHQQIDKKLEEIVRQLDTNFGKMQKQLDSKFDALKQDDPKTELSDIVKKLAETQNHMSFKLQEAQSGMEFKVETCFAQLRKRIEERIDLVEKHIDSKLEEIRNSLERKIEDSSSKVLPAEAQQRNTTETETDSKPKALPEIVRRVEGTWTCRGCYLENKPGVTKCPGCETLNATSPSSKPTTSAPATSVFPAFSFGGAGVTAFGFGDLAKQGNESGFAFGGSSASKNSTSLFSSPTLPMFGVSKPKPTATESREDTSEDVAEEFVPTAEFAPVIPLPPLVEISKGDENENTIYEVRAKLLRLHEDEDGKKEWKERGVGNIKILQDKEKATKVRVVMWREQIHKLACNHRIGKDTKINFYNNSEKALLWHALDFAEGDASKEIFVCKFGKTEQCKEFKAHLDNILTLIRNSPDDEASPIKPSIPAPNISSDSENKLEVLMTNPSTRSSVEKKTEESSMKLQSSVSQSVYPTDLKPKSLTELFNKVEGTWTCKGCYLENKPDVTKCPACQTLNETITPNNNANPTNSAPTSLAPLFPAFSFGGAGVTSFGFGDLAKQGNEGGFAFGGSKNAASLFSSPTLPMFGVSKPTVTESHEDTNEDAAEEFVPTAEFAPVIPLPPLVEISKGDENENTIYEVRAKLLRLHEDVDGKKEWKERGVGNIKILQDKEKSTKVRIVMWREQIHKLACNHRIGKDTKINFYNNSEKALLWHALDYAEGDASKEIFVCKFGKAEQCNEFKTHLDNILTSIRNSPDDQASPIKPSILSPHISSDPVRQGEALKQPPLSELFKKVEGSWTCSGCYLVNNPQDNKCPSCETLKPGVNPIELTEPKPVSPIVPSFTFGFKPALPPTPTAVSPAIFQGEFRVAHDSDDSKSSCTGCIGCDPENYDFTRLENRHVVSYPEQSMTPEEFKNHLSKEKLTNFSFTDLFNNEGSPPLKEAAKPSNPVFSGFGSTNSFNAPTSSFQVPMFGNSAQSFSFASPSFGVTNPVRSDSTPSPGASSIKSEPVITDTGGKGDKSEMSIFGGAGKLTYGKHDESGTTLNTVIPPSNTKTTSATPTTSAPVFPAFSFGGAGVTSFGFGDLAKQGNEGGFAFGGSSASKNASSLFSSPVLPMFGGSKPIVTDSHEDHTNEDVAEEFVPTAEFAPVIPLPPLVEISKGDENENTIYEVRAKLLRLHEDEDGKKEWKERGVGNIKILQDKEKSTKVRIVMWREQIHKLACNHRIGKDTKINFYNNSEKALLWHALDYAEGDASKEIFVCKFGKAEQCNEFKAHLDNILTLIRNSPDTEASPVAASVMSPSLHHISSDPVKQGEALKQPPLSELFKKVEGSWSCSGCYLVNKPQDNQCPSCETLRPGVNRSELTEPKPVSPIVPSFTFGFKPASVPPAAPTATIQDESRLAFSATSSSFQVPTFGNSTQSFSFGSPSFGLNAVPLQATPATSANSPLKSERVIPDEEGEDDEDDEYEDEEPIFEGVGKLRYRKHGESEMRDLVIGLVCLSYDSDIYCNRFTYLEETEDVPAVDHIICADTQLNSEGELGFSWSALVESEAGYLDRLELEVTFDNLEISNNFLDRWSDSTEMASQANVTEGYLQEEEQGE